MNNPSDTNPYDTTEASAEAATATTSSPGIGRYLVRLSVFVVVVLLLGAFLLPAIHRDAGGAMRRTQCRNNLRQIGLALHFYHDEYDCFPPAYTVNDQGKKLHSWRTLILPFLEQQALYDSIDLTVPWNHPNNAQAGNAVVEAYCCPATGLSPQLTIYQALVGETLALHPTRGRLISEITDGTSNTLMVMEVPINHAVEWMSPEDTTGSQLLAATEDELAHGTGRHFLMCDGSMRFVSADIRTSVYHNLLNFADGEQLSDDSW